MKKILYAIAIIFVLLLNFVSAQDSTQKIVINLIEYHPDSYYSRLQIRNDAGMDLNDLILKIDEGFETKYEGIFKDGANYNLILNIPPGEHQVTVATKEGVSSSKLVYFSLSKQEVKEEVSRAQEETKKEQELKQTAQKNLEAAQSQIDVERQKAIELGILKEGKNSMNIILIGVIIALIVGIVIIYWIIRGKKE